MLSRFWDAEKTLFSDFFDVDSSLWNWKERMEVPSVNIVENEKDFVIEMAAPGKNRDDFQVEVQDGYLKISCEKEERKEEKEPNFRRKEFSYDYFSRSLALPENCLADEITAKYEHGILHLRLPKKEVVVPKPAKKVKVG